MSFRLLNLIKMLDNKGVSAVDAYLNKHTDLLDKLKPGELERFINYYLSFNFDIFNKYPFAIYTYLRKSTYLKKADLINTNYFNTMSSGYALESLKTYYPSDETFANYIISKLDKDDISRLSNSLGINYIALNEHKLPALISKLKKYHNVKILHSFYWNLNSMKMDFLDLLINNYSEEEIKEFALMQDLFSEINEIIYRLIDEERTKEALNIIIKLRAKKLANKKDESGFTFLNSTFKKDVFAAFAEFGKEECYEYLEKIEEEIINTNNYDLMYYWVITNNGPHKTEILEKMLRHEELNLSKLVLALDHQYAEYILRKICDNMEVNVLHDMFNQICQYINNNSINKVDYLISLIHYLRPSYKLSKCVSIELLGFNTKHYRLLLNNYDYSQEERLQILENLKVNQNYNLIAIYGSYYLTGDKNKIVDESIIEENTQVLRLLKSTNL